MEQGHIPDEYIKDIDRIIEVRLKNIKKIINNAEILISDLNDIILSYCQCYKYYEENVIQCGTLYKMCGIKPYLNDDAFVAKIFYRKRNGKLLSELEFGAEYYKYKIYYGNQKIVKEQYSSKYIEKDLTLHFNEHGKLMNEILDGEHIVFYESGKIWSTCKYENKKLVGNKIVYRNDGTIWYEKNEKDEFVSNLCLIQ